MIGLESLWRLASSAFSCSPRFLCAFFTPESPGPVNGLGKLRGPWTELPLNRGRREKDEFSGRRVALFQPPPPLTTLLSVASLSEHAMEGNTLASRSGTVIQREKKDQPPDGSRQPECRWDPEALGGTCFIRVSLPSSWNGLEAR
eukprot:s3540_g3.t1